MRITFAKNIKTMSGKCKNGNMVFMSMKNDTICIGRNFTYPLITQHHKSTGSKLKAAASLWKLLPNPFKEDLEKYAKAFNLIHLHEKKLKVSPFNVFIMGVCKADRPLESISEITDELGSTLNNWIQNKYLKNVSTETPFTATID